jgi:hypothetical protein
MAFECVFVVIGMTALPFMVPAVHVIILPFLSGRKFSLSITLGVSLFLGIFSMLLVAEIFAACWKDAIDRSVELLAISTSSAFYFLSVYWNRLFQSFSEAWKDL